MSADAWTLVGLHAAVRFTIIADATTSLLPRLMQPFARRDLIPDSFHATRTGDQYRVEIALAAMPAESVHLVAGNLRQMIDVRTVAHTQEITGQVRRHAA